MNLFDLITWTCSSHVLFLFKRTVWNFGATKTTNKKRKIKLMRCVSVCLDFVVEMGQFVFQFILIHQMDSIYGIFVSRNTLGIVPHFILLIWNIRIEMSFLKSVILQWAIFVSWRSNRWDFSIHKRLLNRWNINFQFATNIIQFVKINDYHFLHLSSWITGWNRESAKHIFCCCLFLYNYRTRTTTTEMFNQTQIA